MAFHYKSPSGIKINSAEEQLLESIDTNLADLHSNIEVVLSDETDPRQVKYTMTSQQWNKTMCSLEKKDNELQRQFEKKRDELFEKQRSGEDEKELWKEKWWLEYLWQLCSIQKEFYENNTKQLPNGEYQIEGNITVLGEYDQTNKRVILYYDSIKQAANPKGDKDKFRCLFAVVYVHEMMHAYLDTSSNTIKEIEEPIVESAMLEFFQNYDKGIFEFAKQHVEEKQFELGLTYYGFGYYVFKDANNFNWLADYRNAKNSLVKTDHNVATYLDYWKTGVYPDDKEKECLEALYKALHCGSSKPMKVKSAQSTVTSGRKFISPKVVYEQSKNKNDLIRKLDDYLALHSPIAPLAIAVTSSAHENWLYRGWKDSSARQYYDWLDPKKHSELIPLLNKHGLYGSIYNCVDLQQIANIYKELVDKTKPEAINAYGNSENMVSAIRHFIEHLLEINHIIL